MFQKVVTYNNIYGVVGEGYLLNIEVYLCQWRLQIGCDILSRVTINLIEVVHKRDFWGYM
jgi:hypothetical protein